MGAQELDLAGLRRVYGRAGSRCFYALVARNARHWGWTEPGQSKWRLWRAQRQVEDVLGRKLALPAGARVLDAGCGSGVVARAMATRFGLLVAGVDVLDVLLAEARRLSARAALADRTAFTGGDYHRLPFGDGEFDGAYSMETLVHSYDPRRALAEFHRVLRPGGRLVFSTTHPIRWAFADDPGPQGLTVMQSYFDRTPYVETDADGETSYVEHHRTLGDRVRELVGAGLVLLDLVEPEWPQRTEQSWGGWSPLRGGLIPGTAIFVCTRA